MIRAPIRMLVGGAAKWLSVVLGVCGSALLFYLFTSENAWAYAILSAMGAQRRTITLMAGVQALICGPLGYGLGIGFSGLLGGLLPAETLPHLAIW